MKQLTHDALLRARCAIKHFQNFRQKKYCFNAAGFRLYKKRVEHGLTLKAGIGSNVFKAACLFEGLFFLTFGFAVIEKGGFSSMRRATETPFDMILEARP